MRSLAPALCLLAACGDPQDGKPVDDGLPIVPVSADTVHDVVAFLADDALLGRDNLTEGNLTARAYLQDRLVNLGFEPLGTNGYEQAFDLGTNLLGVRRSSDDAPWIMLGAHFDHLGFCVDRWSTDTVPICNGAADNAAGVAAVIGVLEALTDKHLHANLAVGLWDAEEDGLVGSHYFTANPTFDLTRLSLYVNIDNIGNVSLRGFAPLTFAVGAEVGGETLRDDVRRASKHAPYIELHNVGYAFGRNRSDMDAFIDNGWQVPFVYYGDGDGSVYHAQSDDLVHLDLDKVVGITAAAATLVVQADARGGYEFVPPELVGDFVLPIEEDVPTIYDLLVRIRAGAELAELSQANIEDLDHWIELLAPAANGDKAAMDRAIVDCAFAALSVFEYSRGLARPPYP